MAALINIKVMLLLSMLIYRILEVNWLISSLWTTEKAKISLLMLIS